MTPTLEEYDRIVALLAKLLLQQMDMNKLLIECLTPEGRDTLAKVGRLVEKPASTPKSVV